MLIKPSELIQVLEILEFQLGVFKVWKVLDFKVKFLDVLDIQTKQFCYKV